MSYRAKILIIAGLILLFIVIGIILAVAYWPGKKTTEALPTNQAPATTTIPGIPGGGAVQAPKPLTPTEMTEVAREILIKNQTKNFVERFGSYSQEANFSNFDELLPVVTSNVASWLKSYPQQLKEKNGTDFVGVTTKVVTQKILSVSPTSATVMASAQQEITRTGGTTRVYKDIKVNLVFANDEWLIDGAYWQ